jgi:hypothetical protein
MKCNVPTITWRVKRKLRKYRSENERCPGRDSNRLPPEIKLFIQPCNFRNHRDPAARPIITATHVAAKSR